MLGRLISREEYENIVNSPDFANYGYECVQGAVNTSAKQLILSIGDEIYLFDEHRDKSELYKNLQEKLYLERLNILRLNTYARFQNLHS